MLIDEVTLTVIAGNGGNGKVSFRREAFVAKGGPDGGNGGIGGSIYAVGSANVNDLRQFRYKKEMKAETGIGGKGKNLFGRNAPDLIVELPLGTIITDTESDKVWEITKVDQKILLARGGAGGKGNREFATATNQTPRYAEPGGQGETKVLHIELKRIADIGLIGLPNAGKSSLLSVLTNATPKIGDYPFTTLEPNIGMMGKFPIADIPGLIEGASQGKGLGTTFLKHIEKTTILVHCIDCSQTDLWSNYEVVRKELAEYGRELVNKLEVIVLLKTDLIEENDLKVKIKLFKEKGKNVLHCSLFDDQAIQKLAVDLEKILKLQKN